MKKLISFLTAFALITSVGCASGGTSEKNSTAAVSVKQTIYKEDTIELGEAVCETKLIECCGDTCFYFYMTESALMLTKLDTEGNILSTVKIFEPSVRDLTVNLNDDGSFDIAYIVTDFEFKRDESGIITNYEEFYSSAEISFKLDTYDGDGKLLRSRDIAGLDRCFESGTSHFLSMEEYNGGFILSIANGIAALDDDGNVVDENGGESYVRFGRDSDGNVIAVKHERGVSVLDGKSISIPPAEYVENIDIPPSVPVKGTNGFKFFLAQTDKLIGVTEGGECLNVLDFTMSFIDNSSIIDFCAPSENTFLALSNGLKLYTKRPDDYVSDRREIKAVTIGNFSANIDQAALEFARSNDNYYVNCSVKEEFDELKEQLLTGDAPDIIIYNETMITRKLVNLGGLVDLNPFLDSDFGIGRDEIMPNVLEAYDMNGGIYALPRSFGIDLFIANSDYIGKEYRDWSFDDFFKFYENRPEGMTMFFDGYGSYIIDANTFIDGKNYTCSFDSPEFIKLVSIASKLNDTLKFTNYEDELAVTEYTKKHLRSLKDHTSMIELSKPYNISYLIHEIGSYGLSLDDAALLSPPGSGGKAIISPSGGNFSIIESGSNKEGAWEFLSYLFSEENQSSSDHEMGYFWINKKAFEKGLEHFVRPDDDPNIFHSSFNDVEYDYIHSITAKQKDEFTELIRSCTALEVYDLDINDIIYEELQRCSHNEISPEECAKNIQSRMEIHLGEQK